MNYMYSKVLTTVHNLLISIIVFRSNQNNTPFCKLILFYQLETKNWLHHLVSLIDSNLC